MKRLLLCCSAAVLLAACDHLPSFGSSEPSALEQQTALANAQTMRKSGDAESAIRLMRAQPENE